MGVAWVGEVYTVGVIASGRSVGGGSAAVLGEKGESWRVEVERVMSGCGDGRRGEGGVDGLGSGMGVVGWEVVGMFAGVEVVLFLRRV